MKLSLTKCKRKIFKNGWLEVEHLKETIIIESIGEELEHDPFELRKEGGYKLGGWGKGFKTYKIYKIHEIEPTFKNKMLIRQKWNINNAAYACCVACGKELHEHNKTDHYESKYGLIGPECYKKLMAVL